MKVLLLAAGRSKRMQPVKDKNFLNFLGKPLILHQIDLIRESGFNEIVVVGGAHNLHELKGACQGCEVVEQEDLDAGMCGAVLAAKDKISGDGVLIVSSNDVVDGKAFNLIKNAAEGESDSYILGKKVSEYFPGGYLNVGDDGLISGIVEKPEPGTEPSDLVNLVVHYHKHASKLIEYLEQAESESDDLYEVALDKLIKDGVKMEAVEYDGFWQPIKFPWHVHNVFRHFFEGMEKSISPDSEISGSATIKGHVVIESGVKVFDNAVINGPAYIGKGCVIANNSLVRDSHLGANCVVGYSTEVARSFLGHDVWTHSNYIGDSVIGNNVSFGAGTVTGNLRLDEKNICVDCDGQEIDSGTNKFGLVTGDNVRAGINTSFMPGVKIGADSFIGAGIVIAENIPEKSFVRGSFELKISENKTEIGSDRSEFKNKLK